MNVTRFKDTEIGRIPECWDVKFVKDITDIVTGATPSTSIPSYWNNGNIPWMSSGELNNKMIYDVKARITQKGYNNTGTHMLPPHCVLIGLAGQGKTRGTAAYNHIELCTNQSIAAILPNNDSFDSLFLYHYIDSIYSLLRQLSAGDGGRGGLNKQILLNLQIPLPSRSEQSRISSALTCIDDLISSLDILIKKKKDIKQGIMQQLLTGKIRLKGSSESWDYKQLGKIGFTFNGLTGKTKEDFGRGNARYITFLNVLNNPILKPDLFEEVVIKEGERQNNCHKGDLFFNTSSETPEEVGICAMLDSEVDSLYLNSFCFGYRLTDPNIVPEYLAYYFRSNEGRKLMTVLAQGVTRYNLSKSAFNRAKILLPTSFSEQKAIVEVLMCMDNEISALEAKKTKYVSIKQGMMQELLTGKIRLI